MTTMPKAFQVTARPSTSITNAPDAKSSMSDVTGSVTAPASRSEDDWRRTADGAGERYRANPKNAEAAIQYAQALRASGQRVEAQLQAGEVSLTADQTDLLAKCTGIRVNNTTANQIDAIEELIPDDFSAARTQTLLFANTQYVSVMDRLIALRGGARGLSLAGLNIIVDGKMVPLAQLEDMVHKFFGGCASADEPGGLLSDKWGLWARGNYSFGEKDVSAASPAFDADQWAFVGGLVYRLFDRAVIGGAVSYGSSSVDFAADDGGLDTDSFAVSLYGSAYAAKNFYFDGMAQIHMDSWTNGRVALVGDAGYCASPLSGQGTSLALVGAYVLAQELGEDFGAYEQRMRPFVEANQEIGRLHVQTREVPEADAEPAVDFTSEAFGDLINRAINGVDLPDYADVPDSGPSLSTSSAKP